MERKNLEQKQIYFGATARGGGKCPTDVAKKVFTCNKAIFSCICVNACIFMCTFMTGYEHNAATSL